VSVRIFSSLFVASLFACAETSELPDASIADATPFADAASPPREIGCDDCTTFTGAMVFDGENASPRTVVIRGDRIVELADPSAIVVRGTTVDASGKTILPGLFDLHVHTPASSGPRSFFLEGNAFEPHFRTMLRSGVTSYLDLGTSARVIFAYRDRLRTRAMLGPRLFAAGPLVTATGGHPCYHGTPPGDACVFVDTPTAAESNLPALLAEEPDVVKIVIESGVLEFSLPELEALSIGRIQAMASAAGRMVIAHVSEPEDLEIALDQNVRLFAHVPSEGLISPELAARMAAAGAIVVPTLAVFDAADRLAHGRFVELDDPSLADDVPAAVIDALRDPAYAMRLADPAYQAWSARAPINAKENVRRLVAAGVRIATGTDAGNAGVFHGRSLLREIALYVEIGLTPIDALRAATRTPADLLGRSDLGRIASGATADLLMVEGDATRDVGALFRTWRVYLGGELLDRTRLTASSTVSLAIDPPSEIAEGETCLATSECTSGLYCGWQDVCADTCGDRDPCATGSACFPQSDSLLRGFCYEGDGCDPRVQDCTNGEACIWIGNGATLCWVAGQAVAGERCDLSTPCARGHQCDLFRGVCEELCDPEGANTCPPPQLCRNRSGEAGLLVGTCGS
jgi:imidazolonepropionase-like amidohydrolase